MPLVIRSSLDARSGTTALMASPLYAADMRLLECLRLRVVDVGFEQGQLILRDGNRSKDRMTRLPKKRHFADIGSLRCLQVTVRERCEIRRVRWEACNRNRNLSRTQRCGRSDLQRTHCWSNCATTAIAMISGALPWMPATPIGQVMRAMTSGSIPRCSNRWTKRCRLVFDPISPR